MKKSALILALLTFCVSAVFAQDYAFKVLASKGVAQVDNGSGWTVLKSGAKLNKKSKVKVAQGSYVGLMHNSGKTLELKKEGVYTVANLQAKLNTSQSSFTSKYSSFVMNKMTSGEGGQNYNVTGSVSRGGNLVMLASSSVKMFKSLPAVIAWEYKDGVTYKVTLKSLFDEELFATETKNKYVELDLSKLKVEEGKNYELKVVATDANGNEDSSSKVLTVLSKEKEKTVSENISKFDAELDGASPMDQLTYVGYYNEHGFTTYALSHLSKAKNLAPEVEDFNALRLQYYYSKQEEK